MTYERIQQSTVDAMKAINTALAAAKYPDPSTPEGLEVLRNATFQAPAPTELTPVDRTLPNGQVVRIIRPDGPVNGVVFHVHGGGFVLGKPSDDDAINDRLARTAQVAVVSTTYRLAPEHPFPANLDDCLTAARWLADNVEAEFGTDRIVISGYSAGGYLAAQTLLRLRDLHPEAFRRFVGASLVFGVYDLSRTPSVRRSTPDTIVLPSHWTRQFTALAFPGLDDERLRSPEFSPLHADLTGLPPALFTVGDLDPLLDDSLFLSARWTAAGNESDLSVWPHSPHGFVGMTPPTGLLAQARINAWIADLLAARTPTTVVRAFIDEVVNGGDLDRIDDLWAPDLVWHGGSLGEVHGIEDYRTMLTAAKTGSFTGMELTVHELIAAGDQVVVRFTNSGTQDGPFLGLPATGKHAEWLGVGIYTVRNGRITEAWFAEDVLGMLLQLGALSLGTLTP
ncbi:alpha/beta hydrolase fold domain-containing protein [Umezawaea sp. NPDC059074]|uniref:alpha/beta hydrolase fold domain-containing protein n=1 Tax=Umezawaea sp. NPDC059074 TaxID=3346716 RepID=UPI0036796E83